MSISKCDDETKAPSEGKVMYVTSVRTGFEWPRNQEFLYERPYFQTTRYPGGIGR
jgi:hypothetical protein